MKSKLVYLFVVVLVVFASAGYYLGFESCEDQLAYDYSPFCLKCNERSAERGDPGAAYNLALFFEGRASRKSNGWIRIAAERGDRRAISRMLTDCGDRTPFSYKDSEKILMKAAQKDPRGVALEAMYFYLGGSCGPLDLEQVRHFYLKDIDDDLRLCRVALKYGEVVMQEKIAPVDRTNALELLQQCIGKANPAGETYREASRLISALDMTPPKN